MKWKIRYEEESDQKFTMKTCELVSNEQEMIGHSG